MNIFGLVLVVLGVIFLIYSVISKNKVNIYNRRYDLLLIVEHKFLKLQLAFSIFNSVFIIAWGLMMVVYNLPSFYILFAPLPFHFINFICAALSRSRGYIKYEKTGHSV